MTQPDTPAAHGRPTQRTAAMSFIMVAVLIDMIAIGLMIPVLPHLVGSFTQSNDEQTLAFLAVTLTFGVANFVASPVLGALSDRYGRRPVLLLGFAGLALSFFITALATALWMLVAVRLFSGAMHSNMAIANAYVADISAPQERAKRFGQLGAMSHFFLPAVQESVGDLLETLEAQERAADHRTPSGACAEAVRTIRREVLGRCSARRAG